MPAHIILIAEIMKIFINVDIQCLDYVKTINQ